jgi:hypothetical protein
LPVASVNWRTPFESVRPVYFGFGWNGNGATVRSVLR